MDNIGAEVGQKMRSAIKAKLMELGCYVDDELPDYIMVMVANKRTKSQMNEDLQLFLAAKTSTFVDWLQVVLKKLKEITVTNPDIYKRVSKRKVDETSKPDLKVKKEKKEKRKDKKKDVIEDISPIKSLTDEIPVEASKLSEMRKIVMIQENQNSNISSEIVNEDSFDIPPLSEVALSNENELAEIEEKIRSVKSRLGIQVTSDFEDDDFINLKAEPEELFPIEKQQNPVPDKSGRKIQLIRSERVGKSQESNVINESSQQKSEHPRIIFGNDSSPKKQSALSRLGKRNLFELNDLLPSGHKKQKISLTKVRQEEEEILGIKSKSDDKKRRDFENRRGKESVLKRLGVMSKVAIPQKETPPPPVIEAITKDVPSVIKVKPRTMPPTNKQANKNLLLKAVAEAQRSIAQTRTVGGNAKPNALYTKKYRENQSHSDQPRKLSSREKSKIKSILVQSEKKDKKELNFSSDDDLEYVPKPVKRSRKSNESLEYIPSSKEQDEEEKLLQANTNQTFIITLDGVNKKHEKLSLVESNASVEEAKKRKSPIVFDKSTPVVTPKKSIPEKLPVVKGQAAIKTKERCKYWPMCRQGDKCEFVHPITPCKSFPQCKFGDKCLYVHPMCKFESSCTRKDCSYSHSTRTFNPVLPPTLQKCKFFPNCTNVHCMFYHPRACKYGKYCKNQSECTFMHEVNTKNSFTWRSTIQS